MDAVTPSQRVVVEVRQSETLMEASTATDVVGSFHRLVLIELSDEHETIPPSSGWK